MEHENWITFKGAIWKEKISVRDFIQDNYTPYIGDASFLTSATKRTKQLMKKLQNLFDLENKRVAFLTLTPPPFLH